MVRAASLGLVLVLAACSAVGEQPSEKPVTEPSEVQATASVATPSPSSAAEWTEPAAYSFTLESRCGERNFIGRFAVEVENGEVTSVEALDAQGQAAAAGLQPSDVPTLAGLLDLVAAARSDGAETVNLVRDPADGHPVSVEIDWQVAAIDDEECYTVSDFVHGQ